MSIDEGSPYQPPQDQSAALVSKEPLPEIPLARNSVFHGLVSTQFLGAFNDNYFKQMVLLKCTELATSSKVDLQPYALAAFALPFVLLYGIDGYISDRVSKRSVVVWCKVAEM